jgi:hypothetical protein
MDHYMWAQYFNTIWADDGCIRDGGGIRTKSPANIHTFFDHHLIIMRSCFTKEASCLYVSYICSINVPWEVEIVHGPLFFKEYISMHWSQFKKGVRIKIGRSMHNACILWRGGVHDERETIYGGQYGTATSCMTHGCITHKQMILV